MQTRLSFCHWLGVCHGQALTVPQLEQLASLSDEHERYASLPSADPFLLLGLHLHERRSHLGRLFNKITDRRLKVLLLLIITHPYSSLTLPATHPRLLAWSHQSAATATTITNRRCGRLTTTIMCCCRCCMQATGEAFKPVVRQYNAATADSSQDGGEEEEEEDRHRYMLQQLSSGHEAAGLTIVSVNNSSASKKRSRYAQRQASSFLPAQLWRAEAKMLATHPLFSDFILFMIALNSYVLCWANPNGRNPFWLQIIQIIRYRSPPSPTAPRRTGY